MSTDDHDVEDDGPIYDAKLCFPPVSPEARRELASRAYDALDAIGVRLVDVRPEAPEAEQERAPANTEDYDELFISDDGSYILVDDLCCPRCHSYRLGHTNHCEPRQSDGSQRSRKPCLDCGHGFSVIRQRPHFRKTV